MCIRDRSAQIDSIGLLTAGLLDSPERLATIAANAYDFIRTELPLRPAVERLLDLGEQLVKEPRKVAAPESIEVPGGPGPLPPGWPQHVTQMDLLGVGLRRIDMRMRRAEQMLGRMVLRLERHQPSVIDVAQTPSYDGALPQVSVLIPLFNHHREVEAALDSVASSAGVRVEVIVQDDGSVDGSGLVVEKWIQSHPLVPARLIRSLINEGPSATRNMLLEQARAPYVFMLDADNGVYPPALERLRGALEQDCGADFAYSAITCLRAGRPAKLISSRPWKPELLRQGPYIDNMAMWRTAALRQIGGWDPTMFAWEDFHLWARVAEAGGRGAYVPQVLSWYRMTDHSNSIEAALDFVSLWSRIRAAAPTVMHE